MSSLAPVLTRRRELGLAALAYTGRFTFERAASDRQVITLLEDARAMLAEKVFIARRVARLPERCGRVLGTASVFGRAARLWLPDRLRRAS